MTTVPKGAVAAGHSGTCDAATTILEAGGNAFDAILAALAAACIFEPIFASPGGGGHMIARPAGKSDPVLYDFFASTPLSKRAKEDLDFQSIHVEFGTATQEFHIGYGASATPGFVPGLFAVHEDLATLQLQQIFEPALKAAKEGITVNAFQAYLFEVVRPIISASKETKAHFAPTGEILTENEIVKNEPLGNFFEELANQGEQLFRSGDVAKAIAKQNKENGGYLTLDDLQTYQVKKRKPLHWRFQDADVFLNPAPAASGPLIAFGLGHLQNASNGNAPILNLAEAMTATNELRSELCNADSATIAEQLAKLQNHKPAYRGTTHISVIDAQGNAAAATLTNGEGNGHLVEGCGFMMNNMLGEEDLNPEGFHNWSPGTRLSTMMAPTLITEPDGSITVLGSGGSNRIRTAILQVINNLISQDMTLENAISAPRIHLEKCGTMSFEDLLSQQDRELLLEYHSDAKPWKERNFFFGGVQAARRDANQWLTAVADERRSGKATTA